VVFHDEVEKGSCFLLNARVQVLTGEGPLHRAQDAAERVVALHAEHHVFRELSRDLVHNGACDLVIKLDSRLGAVGSCESAVVLLVEKFTGCRVAVQDLGDAGHFGVVGSLEYLHNGAYFTEPGLVRRDPSDHLSFQHVICPSPETDAFRRLHAVSDRNHHVEVVVLDLADLD
jgi:hypothetical protein